MGVPGPAEDPFTLGRRLHGRVGGTAEAERAYRQAVAAGCQIAWLNLGILLAGVRGREADEEAALRKALDSDDPGIVSWAALRLGSNLEWLQADPEGARAFFEMAAACGTGVTARHATLNLAFQAAHRGDRAEAREALQAFVVAFGQARDIDMADSGLASFFAAVASGRMRRLWRRYRRAVYFASRRRRALFGASHLARWLGRSRRRAR